MLSLRRYLQQWLLKDASSAVGGSNISAGQSSSPYAPQIPPGLLVRRVSSWAYKCISINARTAAKVPLRLYARKATSGQKSRFKLRPVSHKRLEYMHTKANLSGVITGSFDLVEVLDHPLLDLLRTVNDFMNAFDLKSHVTQSLECTGKAYWRKVRKAGFVEALWPLPPQNVRVLPDRTKFIRGYEYGTGSEKIFVKPEDMVNFKYITLRDNLYGLGPMEAAVKSVDLSNAMDNYETTLFRSGGRPDMVLTYPENQIVGVDEIKRVKRDFGRQFHGTGNAGKLTVATGGATLAPISISPKEIAYLKGREWTLQEIFGIYGVPLVYVKVQEISRDNAHQAKLIHAENTIEPILTLIEEDLNEQLIPDFDDNLILAYDDPRPVDMEQRLKQIDIRLGKNMTTINEERAIDGLDPVPWGDKPIIPPPAFGAPAGSNDDTDKRFKASQPTIAHPAATFEPELFIQRLEDYFFRVKMVVMSNITDDQFKQIQTKVLPDDVVAGWFNMDALNSELARVAMPFVRASMVIGGERALRHVADLPFNPLHPGVLGALQERSGVIAQANNTVRTQVRTAVAEGIEAGEGIGPIRKRVATAFDTIGPISARRIARTETIWAFNEGAVQGYIQSGIVSHKEWVVANDDRLCPWCAGMDGRTVEITRAFWEKGTFMDVQNPKDPDKLIRMEFTYTDIGHPPLHSNCRCSVVAVLE